MRREGAVREGMIFHIQKYSLHDGPGIRTTVFLKGCPLRCQWCHNPEGQSSEPEIALWPSRCQAECYECLSVCDERALSKSDSSIVLAREKCNLCGRCVEVCPSQAIELAGRRWRVEEVMTEVTKDLVFYEASGGGVTFSGGEPLHQPAFLEALLEESKKRHIHTAVDTCGHVRPAVLDSVAARVDLFLYDLKIMDERKHRHFTGRSNRIVLENLRKLDGQKKEVTIRIPLLPGINDGQEELGLLLKFLRSLSHIHRLSLLPYHELGKAKARRFSVAWKALSIHPPSADLIAEVKEKLESSGFQVTVGG